MPENYQLLYILGPVGILFLFAIKEFFSYLKNKNGGNKTEVQLARLNEKMDNHIEHITRELIRITANIRKNTNDTNRIKEDIAVIKEKLK